MQRLLLIVALAAPCQASLVSHEEDAEGQLRAYRQAMPGKAWPGARIPISFAAGYPEALKASVRLGMSFWERNTCVRFIQNQTTATDRAEVVAGGACTSSVGRQGGRQTISLGWNCDGICSTAHELAHCIGLQHMQTRPDRDQYITVVKENLGWGMYDLNYKIEPDSSSMGLPYDYTSLLHYGPYEMVPKEWAGKAGIIPKDPLYKDILGNYYPSFYDVSRVNRMYKCDAACASSTVVCRNNGEKDVNSCSRCRCAPGWGGNDCSANPTGAIVLSATATQQTYTTTLGNMDDPKAIDYDFKHIVINAPAGKRVQLTIPSMWASYDPLCKYGGVEVFTKVDTRIGPPRTCGMSLVKPSYTSDSSRMYLRLFKRIYQVQLTITYKAV